MVVKKAHLILGQYCEMNKTQNIYMQSKVDLVLHAINLWSYCPQK